ncbi:MAG: hypothetical protein Q8R44_10760, partial [Novosphingobium sp.]|nr:hypothetical protein [Novosphingobium sp.]
SGGRAAEEMAARLQILRDHLFGKGKYFGENYGLRDVFCLLQLKNLYNHFRAWRSPEAEKVLKMIVDADYLLEFNRHQPEWQDAGPQAAIDSILSPSITDPLAMALPAGSISPEYSQSPVAASVFTAGATASPTLPPPVAQPADYGKGL